jgi:uncharacterized alpha-E superfamily protein
MYWMSRYLERAEHTARLLTVTLNQMLDQDPQRTGPRLDRMLSALRTNPPPDAPSDPYAIYHLLTFDQQNAGSIAAVIGAARENARQVREQISTEMWEQINRLYLRVRQANTAETWQGDPAEFLQIIKERSHLFQGVTDATMSHDEGWLFIQVGRFIERASATATLLDTYFQVHFADDTAETLDFVDWMGLLKSCTAFEAYCKVYTADLKPECIAEFLLLNATLPRSVRFAADQIERGLQAIARAAGNRPTGRTERLAGRLRSSLDYAQVDEILADNVHEYLESVQRQCSTIHNALYQSYISYPVESALA